MSLNISDEIVTAIYPLRREINKLRNELESARHDLRIRDLTIESLTSAIEHKDRRLAEINAKITDLVQVAGTALDW